MKIKLNVLLALFLSLTSLTQAATVTWTGLGGDDKWSTIANWSQDPTIGGPHVLQLELADTSILDTDTGAWANDPTSIQIGGNHTFTLATGGILTSGNVTSQWVGFVIFDGGTLGNPWFISGSPRLFSTHMHFESGIFQEARISGEDIYLHQVDGVIHTVGKKVGSDFNIGYLRDANFDDLTLEFSLVSGEGVDKLSFQNTVLVFRDPVGTTPLCPLTVDGIQDYIDGGGKQWEWVLISSEIAAPNAAWDLTLVQTGPVDGGLGEVTTTYNEVLLTIPSLVPTKAVVVGGKTLVIAGKVLLTTE